MRVASAPGHQAAGSPEPPALREWSACGRSWAPSGGTWPTRSSPCPPRSSPSRSSSSGVTVAFTALGIIIGFPLIGAVFAVVRWNARIERWRAALTLREPVREAVPAAHRQHPAPGCASSRARPAELEGPGVADVPRDSVGFVASITPSSRWGMVLGTLYLPAWYWSLPEPVQFGLFDVDSLGTAFLAADIAAGRRSPSCIVLQRWVTEGEAAASAGCCSARRARRRCAPASRSSPPPAPASSTPRPPSCTASSATSTTARRRGSSRWRSTSAWPRSASSAIPRARCSSSARPARRPSARSPSCATWPAASAPACSPSAASARR